MSKRKRAPKPAPDESTDDASVKADMVHVTPDLLAGSPDIFASKKEGGEEAETTETPEAAGPPETVSEPIEPEAAETNEPAEAGTAVTPEPPPAPAPEPLTPPPPYVDAVPYPPRPRRTGSSAALGIVLVVVGLFALFVVLSGVDLTENGWPLFILIPGLTLLVVGFISFGSVATIPGGIVTMLGLVLAYANSTGDWPIWTYAWALVVPGGIGLGMYLQALRDRDLHALKTGRTLMFIALMIFLIGFVVFESILGISGRDYFGPVGKGALPGLLIIVGIILLVRSIQRSRQT
jgi:hypothetical protein